MTTPVVASLTAPATALLEGVVAFFEAAGVELPGRRYIAPGAPDVVAWDCEQVAVALAAVGTGYGANGNLQRPMSGLPAGVMLGRNAVFGIQVVRCDTQIIQNDGVPPDPEIVHSAGLLMLRDQEVLSQALVHVAATLRKDQAFRDLQVEAGPVAPFGPEGGYYGCTGTFTVTLAASA